MADSLFFDGVDDEIVVSPGAFLGAVAGQDATYAVVCKLVADEAAYKTFFGYNALDSLFVTDNASPHHITYFPGGGSFPTSTFTIPASDGWCIYICTVQDSGGVVRFHKYVYGTDTWTHADGDNVASISPPALTALHIARNAGGGTLMDGNFLLAAVWNSVLGDVACEALEVKSLPTWVDADPAELWRFNTMSSISSLTGSSAQTARTGTTLDTGDVPAGWDDAEETEALAYDYTRFPRSKMRV